MKYRKKEVTIYDIAQELNVAPSTVSRALNDHYSISMEMIHSVKKLALELGYSPNHIAASLRRNKTKTIGVMMSWINRPFISSLISGIEEGANNAGYNVIISQSLDRYKNEIANAKALYDIRIGGLIVSLAMETTKYDHFLRFIENNIPVVFVDRVSEELNVDKIIIDNVGAGFIATQHLIDQGCKRIAHLSGAQHRNVYRERKQGCIEALKKNNLPVDENLFIYGNVLNQEEILEMTRNLLSLSDPPDGIFAPSDTAAVNVIQCAKKMNIRIPEDLAVIGFNNDPIATIIDPPLSTISHPATEMGKIAIDQVLKSRENMDIIKSKTVTLKTQLIIRESSLRIR